MPERHTGASTPVTLHNIVSDVIGIVGQFIKCVKLLRIDRKIRQEDDCGPNQTNDQESHSGENADAQQPADNLLLKFGERFTDPLKHFRGHDMNPIQKIILSDSDETFKGSRGCYTILLRNCEIPDRHTFGNGVVISNVPSGSGVRS